MNEPIEITSQQLQDLDKDVSHERDRLSSDRMDISFGELLNLYRGDELLIRPEYQRLFRWSPQQKTALIESMLLSIPIPPIFVAEDENGVWELVDGLQRVSTFISFFGELKADMSTIKAQPILNMGDVTSEDIELHEEANLTKGVGIENTEDSSELLTQDIQQLDEIFGNKWLLEEGGLVKSLVGFNIDTLPAKYKINLKRAVCRVEILKGESNVSMKYELFKRLNSGGSALKPQEIRNAIYRGINPELNKLIIELSQNEEFISLTDLSVSKKSELYDQELVLRFIAFLNNSEKVNDNTENYLNSFMSDTVKDPTFDYNYYKETFKTIMNRLSAIGGREIFRNSRNLFIPAVFEGITIGIAQNMEHINDDEFLLARIDQIKKDESFRKASGRASNSKSRIKLRLERANTIFAN